VIAKQAKSFSVLFIKGFTRILIVEIRNYFPKIIFTERTEDLLLIFTAHDDMAMLGKDT